MVDLLKSELIDNILLNLFDFLFLFLHTGLNFLKLGGIFSNPKGGGGGTENLAYQ